MVPGPLALGPRARSRVRAFDLMQTVLLYLSETVFLFSLFQLQMTKTHSSIALFMRAVLFYLSETLLFPTAAVPPDLADPPDPLDPADPSKTVPELALRFLFLTRWG